MKPAPFAYQRPSTVDEAVQMLAAGDAKVLAGGQSLVPILSMRLASPATIVDINHIGGLDDIEVDESGVRIGALTRHRALERDEAVYAANPLLRRALACVAHPTIRNRGTTVGSLVHADPSAEMPAVLVLLGGEVDALSVARGRRTIAAADFVVGPMECCMLSDELAVSAHFPNPAPRTGSAWREVSRRHGDYAIAGVGATLTLADDSTVASARLAFISVDVVPVCVDVSALLAGRDSHHLDTAGVDDLVAAAIDPEPDIHATAEYRAHLARVLAARALREAASDALEQPAA